MIVNDFLYQNGLSEEDGKGWCPMYKVTYSPYLPFNPLTRPLVWCNASTRSIKKQKRLLKATQQLHGIKSRNGISPTRRPSKKLTRWRN